MLAYWGDGDPVAANIVAVPIIQQGLAEIAKVLIGGEGWTIQDSLEEVEHGAARWLLDANRAPDDERVLELKHTGLRSYVGDCEGCYDEEETFTLHDDRGDGIIRFMAGKCGHVVRYTCSPIATCLFIDLDFLGRTRDSCCGKGDVGLRPCHCTLPPTFHLLQKHSRTTRPASNHIRKVPPSLSIPPTSQRRKPSWPS